VERGQITIQQHVLPTDHDDLARQVPIQQFGDAVATRWLVHHETLQGSSSV
jgi:hypothetical protein